VATLLLVEDNELNRDMLCKRLTRRGYRVITAESGEDALVKAPGHLPDLVLMDIGLPGIDGLETTQRLKAAPATAHIPIMALTAHAMDEDRESALAAGCDDFDTKPIELARLLGKIEGLLARAAR
jgi:CheY-like chemotaxis protein